LACLHWLFVNKFNSIQLSSSEAGFHFDLKDKYEFTERYSRRFLKVKNTRLIENEIKKLDATQANKGWMLKNNSRKISVSNPPYHLGRSITKMFLFIMKDAMHQFHESISV